jgi:two-component system sensor histidine kinase ChiS
MKKILCIEDDIDIADVIELALEDLYSVKIINDAIGVTDIVLAFMPDLILIDNLIGLVEAGEVIREIKNNAILNNIPLILCSGHADTKSIADRMSVNDYLEKPFNLADLYAVIDKVLLAEKIPD